MSLDLFPQLPVAVQVHIVTAVASLALGVTMFVRPKGTRSHKLAGRLFLLFMLATAASAYFIRYINEGSFSWIHIFIPVTVFAAFETVFYIRRGNLKGHKRAVKGLFFGALLIPGALSFLPGRTMWMMFFA
ncbi:MAG: DUF2306 domain-containing protein [Litorimonas sp.]